MREAAECHDIWELKPPGTLWATLGLLRDSSFTTSETAWVPLQDYCASGSVMAHVLDFQRYKLLLTTVTGTKLT
jgi:hypothetical protein